MFGIAHRIAELHQAHRPLSVNLTAVKLAVTLSLEPRPSLILLARLHPSPLHELVKANLLERFSASTPQSTAEKGANDLTVLRTHPTTAGLTAAASPDQAVASSFPGGDFYIPCIIET